MRYILDINTTNNKVVELPNYLRSIPFLKISNAEDIAISEEDKATVLHRIANDKPNLD